ncbi:hypothetical protein HB804_05560 [Listeria welshimeri]|nr:hypothetical protein [Listeria welshimeri]MBC1463553.1 hypothetical protein [Listeria welshimeri]MBC1495841.1 hypothetical protein [Listeria welshimeri]MBC1498004.1 hypothetical protein [Listeria welshimeri]MBC1608497.1 hypothetical protein [Listeria welshimeri]
MKHKKWLVIGGIVFILICVFFIWGMLTHSKSDYYSNFKHALENNNAEEMKTLLTTNDDSFKIDKTGSQAFINYLNNNPADKAQFLKTLKRETEGEENSYSNEFPYTLVKDGKDMVFFPHYALSIKPLYFTVTTDADKTSLSTNKKEIPYVKKADKYGPLMPGVYDVAVSLTSSIDIPIVHFENEQLVKKDSNLDLQVGDVLSKDKSFQSTFSKNIDGCMTEFAQYWGGGLDNTKLINVTDNYRESALLQTNLLLPYLAKTNLKYYELQVNNDSIEIEKNVDAWEATVEADINMEGNVQTIEENSFPVELQLAGVRELVFVYDTKLDKWLLDSAAESYSDAKWKNISKITHKNPVNYEWTLKKEEDI